MTCLFSRHFLLAALRFVILCNLGAALYPASQAVEEFQRARDLFNRQLWDEARAAASQALKSDPNMGDAEILLGLIATVQSQFSEAEQHFLRGVVLEPDNFQAHAYLGSTYLQEKKFPDAKLAFEKVLRLKPSNVTANYNLGVVALEQNSAGEALRRFETVLGANDSDVPALTGVLTSELMLHKSDDARRTARHLQDLLSDNDPRLQQVAALLAQYGEPAAAVPIMERLRRNAPQSWEVNYNLAVAFLQSAQYDRAADVLQPFVNTAAKPEALNLLGAIEEKRGHTLESEHAFEAAVRADPTNEEYSFDYGNSLLQHGNSAAAVGVFRTASLALSRSWKLRIGLGSAYYLAGDYENSASALLEAVKLNPGAMAGWFLLGEAYDSASGLQTSIESAFESYLATKPHDAMSYCRYGAILYQRAQTIGVPKLRQQAIENLEQALRLNPKLAEAHLELGLIALAEGDVKRSIAFLEKAVALEPGLAAAHYRLGLAYKQIGNAQRSGEELKRFQALKQDERQRGRVLQSLTALH